MIQYYINFPMTIGHLCFLFCEMSEIVFSSSIFRTSTYVLYISSLTVYIFSVSAFSFHSHFDAFETVLNFKEIKFVFLPSIVLAFLCFNKPPFLV